MKLQTNITNRKVSLVQPFGKIAFDENGYVEIPDQHVELFKKTYPHYFEKGAVQQTTHDDFKSFIDESKSERIPVSIDWNKLNLLLIAKGLSEEDCAEIQTQYNAPVVELSEEEKTKAANTEKIMALNNITKLRELCSAFPEDEWKDMDKTQIKTYLIGKL